MSTYRLFHTLFQHYNNNTYTSTTAIHITLNPPNSKEYIHLTHPVKQDNHNPKHPLNINTSPSPTTTYTATASTPFTLPCNPQQPPEPNQISPKPTEKERENSTASNPHQNPPKIPIPARKNHQITHIPKPLYRQLHLPPPLHILNLIIIPKIPKASYPLQRQQTPHKSRPMQMSQRQKLHIRREDLDGGYVLVAGNPGTVHDEDADG